ncbi:MAG: hypothetical protein H6Q91_224 [Deltaproteobacteria bacterium]|nr:hypothetical protein [Deltaproteobacteria bacterium]
MRQLAALESLARQKRARVFGMQQEGDALAEPRASSNGLRGGLEVPETLRPAEVPQEAPELTNEHFFWDLGKPRAKAP